MSVANPIEIIALGLGPGDLGKEAMAALEGVAVLAGGERLLDMFPDHPAQRLPYHSPLSTWIEEIETASREGRTAVLVSGDSGFFSLAGLLVKRLGREGVRIHPNVSSLQAAFARLGQPWQDAALLSLHARGTAPLWPALRQKEWVGLLTGTQMGPAGLARLLLERGQTNWRVWVFENLGADSEAYASYSLPEAVDMEFAGLNVVILERTAASRPLKLGAPEESYSRQGGLITKAEVRAAALASLDLMPGQTLWDLGAGSGSVGLEACLLLGPGRVIAVEQNPERVADIKLNRSRFGAGNLEVVQGELPAVLAGLDAPDRVFIGGAGAALAETIRKACARLAPAGRVVVSLVKLESLSDARGAFAECGLAVSTSLLQISRGAPLGGGEYLKALNPVYLLTGVKKEAE